MDASSAALEFARGALAGLAICIPPGPMSALCVARSVRRGFADGFAIASGAALGDALYAAAALFGLASVRGHLSEAPRIGALLAAPLLFRMGLGLLLRARRAAKAAREGRPPATDDADPPPALPGFCAGFVMALGTPTTLPAFAALFAALGSVSAAPDSLFAPHATIAGVLAGALLWWAAVAYFASRFRRSVDRYLHVVDAASGVLLVLGSLAALHVAVAGLPLPTA